MHRRALLANAQEERLRHGMTRQKRPGRRRPPRVPPTQRQPPQAPPTRREPPIRASRPNRSATSRRRARPLDDDRDTAGGLHPLGAEHPARPRRAAARRGRGRVRRRGASARSTTSAATVILIAATILMLVVPPPVARRRLTATAETIAAVGLLLIPLDGYALWTVDQIWLSGVSRPMYASVIFAVTAVISYLYARGDRPHRAAVRHRARPAADPAAAGVRVDRRPGRLGVRARGGGRARPGAGPRAADPAGRLGRPGAAGERRLAGDVRDRPEGAPEESDAVVTVTGEVIAPDRARQDRERPDPGRDPGRPRRHRPVRRRHRRGHRRGIHGGRAAGAAADRAPGTAPPTARSAGGGGPAAAGNLAPARHRVRRRAGLYATSALVIADPLPDAVLAATALLVAAACRARRRRSSIGRQPLLDIAAGVMTLAVIAAVGRVAAVAMPGRAMLVIAAAVALTGIAVRAVPALSGPPGHRR